MPYVTDEIMKEMTEEEITISAYPEYEKKLVFKESEKEITQLLEFVSLFRNVKQENNIGKDFSVFVETELPNLALKLLKIEEKIESKKNSTAYPVISKSYKAIIYYEKEETENDRLLKEKQIDSLKSSIERREKLLSNTAYVQKAPTHLVEEERKKLTEEKEKLASLEK